MWKKIVGYGLLSIVAVAGLGFGYFYFRPPKSRPASNITVKMMPERIARGKYIFQLADCDNCHSQHDEKIFQVVDSGRGRGQVFPGGDLGPIGLPNITPDKETGIGAWTDGEKIRAIREGIGKHGQALFPLMPYQAFKHMSDEDVESLVAYLNSLEPIRNAVPRTQLKFPISMLIKGAPEPVTQPVATPSRSNRYQYGEYLVGLGVCISCHTPGEGPNMDYSKKFGGGHQFNIANNVVVSANITPDQDTGIGSWSADYFVERFKRYKDAKPQQFTVMPWHSLAQLPEDDLRMIYEYLRTQTPVRNKVVTRPTQLAQAR